MKRTKEAASDGRGGRPRKSLYVMLGGLVVGGAVGWWRWLRSVRKY